MLSADIAACDKPRRLLIESSFVEERALKAGIYPLFKCLFSLFHENGVVRRDDFVKSFAMLFPTAFTIVQKSISVTKSSQEI